MDALSGYAQLQTRLCPLTQRVFLLWVVYNWRMEIHRGKQMKEFPAYKTVSVSSVMKLMEVIRATA
jgi:hypothetical protein